jgi:hypothetical protein
LGGIDVVNTDVDGFIQRFQCLVFVLIGKEPAAASHAEHRDAGPGLAQLAGGDFTRFGCMSGGGGEAGHRGGFEKLTAAESHPGLMLSNPAST